MRALFLNLPITFYSPLFVKMHSQVLYKIFKINQTSSGHQKGIYMLSKRGISTVSMTSEL